MIKEKDEMIKAYIMNKLYEIVIEGSKLDKKILKEIGMTEEDIISLVKDNIIETIENNEYKFLAVNKLLNYIEKLKEEGNISKALKYFNNCKKMFPENRQVLLNLLLIYIRQNNQEEIYNIFKLLDTKEDIDSTKENNLILCLLNQVTKLPQEYQDRTKNIKLNDISVDNQEKYQNIFSQNRMRKYILENKFSLADIIIRKELNGCFRNQIEKDIILTLLSKIIELRKKTNIYIRNLIDNKNYTTLVSYLEKRHQIRKLNLYEAYVYKISSSIVRIQKVNKIPAPSIIETKILKEAIVGNNYQLALKLINKTPPELSNPDEKENVLILLKNINNLITQIIKDNQIPTKNNKDNEEKYFLLNELKKMKESNEIIIFLDNIDESRKQNLIKIAKTIPELSLIISRYKDGKIILRQVNISNEIINKENLTKKALNSYINGEYKLAISLYLKIIQTSDYIEANTCGMLGLSYLHLSDIEKAIHYMKISIELDRGHKENKIDFKELIEYLKNPLTETNQTKITNMVNKHDAKLIDYDITKEEELACIITSQNMTLPQAKEKLHLTDDQILIIKLIYARNYYSEENYSSGDNLVKEVANTQKKSLVVTAFLTKVRRNRNNYKNINNDKTRKLTKN